MKFDSEHFGIYCGCIRHDVQVSIGVMCWIDYNSNERTDATLSNTNLRTVDG